MKTGKIPEFTPKLKQIKTNYMLNSYAKKTSPLSCDTFELSTEERLRRQQNAIYSRSKKFTIENYNSISRLEKSILRQNSENIREQAKENIRVGLKVKKKLDERYGENGYVFISIGTSSSGIGRVLEFSGVETKYLPVSRLTRYYLNDQYKKFSDKFPQYQIFLNEQGLSEEDVKNSKKMFLFYDYTNTGYSLSVFRNMLKEYFNLDLPNVECHSADYLCYSSCAKKIDPPQYAVDYVKKYMLHQEMAKLGGISHLPLEHIDRISICKTYESLNAKKFNFAVIDELQKKGLLKNNPCNKNSL